MEAVETLPKLTSPEPRSCRVLTLEQEVTLMRKERDVAQSNERAAAVEWRRSQDEVAALKRQLQKLGWEFQDAKERCSELEALLATSQEVNLELRDQRQELALEVARMRLAARGS